MNRTGYRFRLTCWAVMLVVAGAALAWLIRPPEPRRGHRDWDNDTVKLVDPGRIYKDREALWKRQAEEKAKAEATR